MLPFGWAKVVAWNKQSCYKHAFFLSATSVTELNDRSEVYVVAALRVKAGHFP